MFKLGVKKELTITEKMKLVKLYSELVDEKEYQKNKSLFDKANNYFNDASQFSTKCKIYKTYFNERGYVEIFRTKLNRKEFAFKFVETNAIDNFNIYKIFPGNNNINLIMVEIAE